MIPLANIGSFFGVDGMIIFMVVLLLFGAKKLPELARGLGQSLNEFKKAREDIEGEFKAGQQDLNANPRPVANAQPYGQNNVTAQVQALPYNAVPAVSNASEQALQQQVAELEQKLRAMEAQKQELPTSTN